MIVAGLQFDIAWEDPVENFRRVRPLALAAAEAQARLLVLPELFATGFTMRAAWAASLGAESCRYMAELARELDLWLLGGWVDGAAPRGSSAEPPHNALSLFSPRGEEVMRYHKIHRFALAGEAEHYAPGENLVSFLLEGVRITPFICYDLRFPELFQIAAADTDLFVVSANWPQVRAEAWRVLLPARAIENQAYVLGVNRVGTAAGALAHRGDSMLLDPLGETIRDTPAHESALLLGEVDPTRVAATRRDYPFLDDRRAHLYADLRRAWRRAPKGES
jgi:predicted amidohydrolase